MFARVIHLAQRATRPTQPMRKDPPMDTPIRNSSPTLLDRVRSRRLTTNSLLCWRRSPSGILAGSLLTRSVSGKEEQSRQLLRRTAARHSRARSTLSNDLLSASPSRLVPAVVNINTESRCPSSPPVKRPGRSGRTAQPAPAQPQWQRRRSAQPGRHAGLLQPLLRRPGPVVADDGSDGAGDGPARDALSAPASSSTRVATSSPTTMSSTKPTRFS